VEPILTSLVTGVGTAIAKGALKRWLKDYPEALGATGAVFDVLGTVTKDLIDRRRGARQFDDIAEKVAQDAFEVIELTGIELTSTQQRVVVDVAGEVLNRCVSDPEFGASLLARHSLEPSQLSQWFEQHTLPPVPEGAAPPVDPTGGFNAGQRTLYQRLLYDGAQYIVDLGSQFPSFMEKTLSEVLMRQDQVSGKADLILEEVQRIRASLQDDSATEAAFEEKYRRAVIRRLDELQLFGVDVASTSKRYRLSVAYVTLLVERAREQRSPNGEWLRSSNSERPEKRLVEDPEDDDIDDRETVPVDEALASTSRLFVRGPAGSGKTTLLQWVAVLSASRSHAGQLAEWNDRIPFFIKLREFAGKELPLPSIFPILIDRVALAEDLPNGWVKHQLESGRALVLIDGLDELPQEERSTVRAWIDSLVAEYPQARFVVTSRPGAAEEGWLTSEGFLDAELQDMTTPDVHAFIGHWHQAVKEGVQTVEEKDELDDLSEALLQTVKSNRAIHRLATSPLLCAMLCALHRDRIKNLPADRIELYRACIEMFFRRDTERKVALGDYPELGDRQKRTLLADLALWLIRNNLTMADQTSVDERLERSLRSMGGDSVAHITGPEARKLFVERSGILRQPEPGHIDFPHRTFQEYLAAQAAIAESCVGELITNAHRDQWREVLILATGVASEAEAEQIVLGVIERGDQENEQRARLYLLAIACTEAAVRFPEGSGASDEVNYRLQAIVPPRKIDEAKELATAGEIVVPFLEYNDRWTVPQHVACIRCLALVGGEAACAAIAEYRRSGKNTVWQQFAKAFDYISEPDELRAAFARPVSIKSGRLSLRGLKVDKLLPALASILSLRELNLSYTLICDVSILATFTSLKKFFLGYTQVRDISPLTTLTNLQALYLWNTPVSDVSAMVSLSNLQSLYLGHTQVSDVSALVSLTNLRTLSLSKTQVSDVFALASLTNLRTLDLRGTKVRDVSALTSLTSLQNLYISGTRVRDVSALDSLVENGLEIEMDFDEE